MLLMAFLNQDHHSLLHNGGLLPLEDIDDIVPEWKDVKIRDSDDCGPPQRPTGKQLAIRDRPRNPYVIPIAPTVPSTPTPADPTITLAPQQATATPPPYDLWHPDLPPHPRYVAQPPYLNQGSRTTIPTANYPPDNLATHRMQLPPGWQALVSHDHMHVYYHRANPPESTWKFSLGYQLAPRWERRLSTDNVEYFVEVTDTTEYWHKEPRYMHDTTERSQSLIIEDNEHYDRQKTQYIHREIHKLMLRFPEMEQYARAMLDRHIHGHTSKPLCFMSRNTQQAQLDYDMAHYIMIWLAPPDGSRPTIQHLLHRLHQAVNDQPILSPYTNANRVPPLALTFADDRLVFGADAQSHGQPVGRPPPVRPASHSTEQRHSTSTASSSTATH